MSRFARLLFRAEGRSYREDRDPLPVMFDVDFDYCPNAPRTAKTCANRSPPTSPTDAASGLSRICGSPAPR